MITRWRLSSHNLSVESGRHYGIPRDQRICPICNTEVENEHHAIFICVLYTEIRIFHSQYYLLKNSIRDFLNPCCIQEAEELGDILMKIEKMRDTMT